MEGMEVWNTKRWLSGWWSMDGCCENGMKRWEIGAHALENMRDIRNHRIELKRCLERLTVSSLCAHSCIC